MEKQAAHTKELGDFAVEAVRAAEALEELPSQKVFTLEAQIDDELFNFFTEIDQHTWNLQNLKPFTITVDADISQAEEELLKVSSWNTIYGEDGLEIPVKVDAASAAQSAADAKKAIDEKLPAQKLMEIQLQGDIDIELEKIQTAAETLQTAFEWEAKVEIAEIEASTRELEIIATNISDMFENTGDVISGALGALAEVDWGSSAFSEIRKALDAESKRRDALLEQQEKLVAAEIKVLEARAKAITEGRGLITIKAEGLQAELAMVLEKIVQLAQVEANAEGFNALLGI
jgi:hypothetical protein